MMGGGGCVFDHDGDGFVRRTRQRRRSRSGNRRSSLDDSDHGDAREAEDVPRVQGSRPLPPNLLSVQLRPVRARTSGESVLDPKAAGVPVNPEMLAGHLRDVEGREEELEVLASQDDFAVDAFRSLVRKLQR